MNKQSMLTAVVILFVGLGAGYWLGHQNQGPIQAVSPATETKMPLYYRNPMNPSVTSPIPAKDNMGMDYIPVYADDNVDNKEIAGTVSIDPVTVQNIGVRSATATRSALAHIIRAIGRVAYDEERMVHLHPKIDGWVEKMHVDKTGQWVKKNTDLLSIYSPQLVASQQEYLLALSNLSALKDSPIEDIRQGAEELVKSSRQRLNLLDMPSHQIRELANTQNIKKRIHIHTPADGIVMKIGAREGQYVTPNTEIFMIADLTKVWVYAHIYEYELPWVAIDDAVEMQLAGIPGRIFKGHLAYIYPYAESKTRTIKVRLVFDNPDLLLKPEMYAEITIHAGKLIDALVIPSEAVVRSGARNQVFIVREPGKFEPRLVTLGLSSRGKVAVLDGVEEGEKVVTSAQFLIDSESKLREATAKMLESSKQHPIKTDYE